MIFSAGGGLAAAAGRGGMRRSMKCNFITTLK